VNFNNHYNLEGQHAFLSASNYHWINYDEEKIEKTFLKFQAKQMGTRLHAFAEEAIKLGIKMSKSKTTLNLYINDAIGFKMKTEIVLYYSDNCFGTADAIIFKNNFLRIHDYKSGETPTSMKQLEVYVALFCLEYRINPNSISIELRIYQNDEIIIYDPPRENILYIMDKIKVFNDRIEKMKMEA